MFGDFIAVACDACDQRKAEGTLRLAEFTSPASLPFFPHIEYAP